MLYHPKGARIIATLIDWLSKDLYARGYVEIRTPHIYKADVWKTSGHWDYYRDNMYFFETDEGEDKEPGEYGVKPMNCPGAAARLRERRALLPRPADAALRVRHCLPPREERCRPRAHARSRFHARRRALFCTAEQIVPEVKGMLDLVKYIMETFDFEYSAEVSTKPEKSVGAEEDWDVATKALMQALDEWGLPYDVNEGDGAFYGPKIDIKVNDAIGRVWQLSTIQVDFNLPERFDLTYRTAENTEKRPFMLHRAIFGSHRAFLRHPHRAHRGQLPHMARAHAGRGHPDCRPSHRVRREGHGRARRARAFASRSMRSLSR